jgi:hypothetical protein
VPVSGQRGYRQNVRWVVGVVGVGNRMLFAIDLNLGVGMLVLEVVGMYIVLAIEWIGKEEEIWKFVGIEQSFDYLSATVLHSEGARCRNQASTSRREETGGKNIPNINPPRIQKLNTTPFKSTQHLSKRLIEFNSFFCIINDLSPFPICLIEFLEFYFTGFNSGVVFTFR